MPERSLMYFLSLDTTIRTSRSATSASAMPADGEGSSTMRRGAPETAEAELDGEAALVGEAVLVDEATAGAVAFTGRASGGADGAAAFTGRVSGGADGAAAFTGRVSGGADGMAAAVGGAELGGRTIGA